MGFVRKCRRVLLRITYRQAIGTRIACLAYFVFNALTQAAYQQAGGGKGRTGKEAEWCRRG